MSDTLHQAVEAALRGIIDPETGRDLIAMGLIYDIRVEVGGVEDGGAEGTTARITMTTTTPGCPLAEMLRLGAEAAVTEVPGIAVAEVRLTWEPRWTPDRMASAA